MLKNIRRNVHHPESVKRTAKEEVRRYMYKAVFTGLKAGLTAIEIRQIIANAMATYNL